MDMAPEVKRAKWKKRKRSIRRKVRGTAERPRLTIFRSLKHIYAQVIDDEAGRTIATTGTLSKAAREEVAGKKKRDAAEVVGKAIAEACKAKGIEQVVFDRNGFRFHGRVAAVAAAARKAGLKF
jgi:large subunit ribosomal protein L18